jgi:hypothetical protein
MDSTFHRPLWLFAIVGAFLFSGCEQQKQTTIEDLEAATEEASEQKEEAKEAEQELAKTKSEFEETQQRDDYVQAKEKELVEADTTLQQLKDKSSQLSGPEQQDLNSKVDAIAVKRDAAKEQLDEIRDAEPAKWKQMQEVTDKAFTDLKQAISEAQSNASLPAQTQPPDATQTDTTETDASTTGDATQPQAEPSQAGQLPSQQ